MALFGANPHEDCSAPEAGSLGTSLGDLILTRLRRHSLSSSGPSECISHQRINGHFRVIRDLLNRSRFLVFLPDFESPYQLSCQGCEDAVPPDYKIDTETGEVTSYSTALTLSLRAALGWRSLGFGIGDTIAFFTRNSPAVFPALLGAVLEGITVACVQPISTEDEFRSSISLTKPCAIFSDQINVDMAQSAAKDDVIHVVTQSRKECKGVITFENLTNLGHLEDEESYQPAHITNLKEHVVFILNSSGTSGLPKAVGRHNFGYMWSCLDPEGFWGCVANERMLITNFMSWNSGLCISLICLMKGGTRVIGNPMDEASVLAAVEKYQVNSWFSAAPQLQLVAGAVMAARERGCRAPDLRSLRAVLCGGTVLSAPAHRAIEQALGVPVLQSYGATELSIITGTTAERNRHGSVGLPPAGVTIKLVHIDTRDELSDPGARGEVMVKTPCAFKCYVSNHQATVEAFDDEGFFFTGDLGYRDADGYLFIVDRIKELLKYNSMEIAPAELEAVLLEHPDVLEACVVGRPHVTLGDIPTAFVVRKPGSSVSESDLKNLIAGKLSNYKHIRGGVFFKTKLPKCQNGKLNRREMKLWDDTAAATEKLDQPALILMKLPAPRRSENQDPM